MKSSTRILSLLLVLTLVFGMFSMSVSAVVHDNETEMDGSSTETTPGAGENETERDEEDDTTTPGEGEDDTTVPGEGEDDTTVPGEGEDDTTTPGGDNETEVDPDEGEDDEEEEEVKPGKPTAPAIGKVFENAIYVDCTKNNAHDRYRDWEVTKKYTPVWNDFNEVWEIYATVYNIGDYIPSYYYTSTNSCNSKYCSVHNTCSDRYCTDKYCTVHHTCTDRYCSDKYCTVHNTCTDRNCSSKYCTIHNTCTGYHGELDFILDSVNGLIYCSHYDRIDEDTCDCYYGNSYNYYGHKIIRKDATIVLRWSESRSQWYVSERAYVRVSCDGSTSSTCNSKHTHTIKFTDGVSNKVIFKDKTYSVKHNGKIPAVKDPVREGYRFAGWSPKLSTKATACVTYVAQWVSGDAPALTNEHVAYLKGYGKGYVRPEAKVTRAEMATILYRLLDTASVRNYYTSANSFSDVNGGDWYNDAVSTLVNAGIIKGYAGGKYYPNAYITVLS